MINKLNLKLVLDFSLDSILLGCLYVFKTITTHEFIFKPYFASEY